VEYVWVMIMQFVDFCKRVYCVGTQFSAASAAAAQSGFLKKEDVCRDPARGCIVELLRLIVACGRAARVRVDSREVDVGVDDAEDQTQTAEHYDR